MEDDKTASWFYTHKGSSRAIILAIQRQPGTNTIEVTDGVKNLLPLFRTELPPSVNMDILYDRSDTIRESYTDVKFTMVLTLGLVVMVIFLFLRNVSATIIPSLALPFSIIGTFAVMYLLDYSLDNLSMMALILSIGFVVDDAIVMLENIVRHMEMGEKPLMASLEGFARDRLHHRFDDAVAGGGVHPGAVHGRRAGPAVQGIRGHHLRRDSDLGRGFGDADADAVQPLPAVRARRASTAGSTTSPSASSTACCASTTRRCSGRCATAPLTMADLRRGAGRDRVHVRRRFPRASSRIRTRTRLQVYTEAAQGTSYLPDGRVPEEDRRHGRRRTRTWRR